MKRTLAFFLSCGAMILSCPFLSTVNGQPSTDFPQNYFAYPLNISPATIVGNFGEPRTAHFHTGLDFRTNQEEGHAVFAAADGYISRINVSGVGYGNALYITHPNGYVTVYAHLQQFAPQIQARLRKEQYANESFSVDFNLQPNEIEVKKGDTIALSGNTGGSGGPHLHFEIRDSLERVYNPLLFGYKLKDNLKPILSSLKFYPLDELKDKSDGYRAKIVLTKEKNYALSIGNLVKVNSKEVGFSVHTHDVMNDSPGRTGVYDITVYDEGNLNYQYRADRISFPEKRYVLSHTDYAIFAYEGRKSFHKCFVEPGNKCPVYPNLFNRGRVDLSDGKPHKMLVKVRDFAGNVSSVQFTLQYDKASTLFKTKELKYTTLFDYERDNKFSNSDISIKIPKGCLFDNVFFNYGAAPVSDTTFFSKVFTLGNKNTPVFDWFEVSLKTENLPPALADKAVVVYKNGTSTVSRGGKFENNFITSKIRDFGTYYVKLDTTAPKITPFNIVAGRNMRTYKKIVFKISDNLSGIADFDTYVDGKWVVADYDAKSATITHTLDQNLSLGEHIFKVVVEDERKNKSEYEVKFLM